MFLEQFCDLARLHLARLDLTWLDLTWPDLTWLDLTWLDLAWLDLTWLGETRLGETWLGEIWLGETWLGETWLGESDLTLPPGSPGGYSRDSSFRDAPRKLRWDRPGPPRGIRATWQQWKRKGERVEGVGEGKGRGGLEEEGDWGREGWALWNIAWMGLFCQTSSDLTWR